MSLPDVDSDLIPADEWYDPYLRFALYLGGAFQLLCIIAVLILPSGGGATSNAPDAIDEFDSEEESSSSEEEAEEEAGLNAGRTPRHRLQNRGASKKVDKKSKKQR